MSLATLPFIVSMFSAGVFISLQAPINAALSKTVGGPLYAALFSFLIGSFVLLLVAFLFKGAPNIQTDLLKPWMVLGGIFGAFFIVSTTFSTPVLGSMTTIMIFILGQMIASIAIDHYGLFSIPMRPITIERVIGLSLMLAGIIFVVKK